MSNQSDYPLRPLTIVRVGNDNRPACPLDIESVSKDIEKALGPDGDGFLVTHHAVDIQTVYVYDDAASSLEAYQDGFEEGYDSAVDDSKLLPEHFEGDDAEDCYCDCDCSACTGDDEKPGDELPESRPPTWAETLVDFMTGVLEGIADAVESGAAAEWAQQQFDGKGDDGDKDDSGSDGDDEAPVPGTATEGARAA